MRKKKVCITHAMVPFVSGGAEIHVNELVKQIRKFGYDADLIQLPYKWYPEESLYDNLLMWRLLDLNEVNGEKIDLLIGTKFPSYGAIHDNKIAWVIHQYRQVYDLYNTENGYSNMTEEGRNIREKVMHYDRIGLNECKKIFANSKNVANRMKKYNQIDSIPLYHPPALEGRYYHESYGDYILSVGRLDPLKRNDLLIKAICYCGKDVKVKIAGRGPEMETLKKLVYKLKLEEQIEFLGFVSDEQLLQLYANARGVYYAPIDEDYGYITLEAFLSKKPVITCQDSGGVLEFVEQDITGYISSNIPEEIAKNIILLYQSEKKCEELGWNGYNKVKDISWNTVIDCLTETIR